VTTWPTFYEEQKQERRSRFTVHEPTDEPRFRRLADLEQDLADEEFGREKNPFDLLLTRIPFSREKKWFKDPMVTA
jgi:hypothetical protein